MSRRQFLSSDTFLQERDNEYFVIKREDISPVLYDELVKSGSPGTLRERGTRGSVRSPRPLGKRPRPEVEEWRKLAGEANKYRCADLAIQKECPAVLCIEQDDDWWEMTVSDDNL